jgi:thymidine kinase
MVVEGEQVLVGDTRSAAVVAYEVLCRRHYMHRVTAATSMAAHMSATPLPFSDAEVRGTTAPVEVTS